MAAQSESFEATRIDVQAARGPYSALIARSLLGRTGELLSEAGVHGPVVVVSTPRIWKLQGDRLGHLAWAREPVLIGDGERAKTLRTVSGLYESFAGRGLDRGAAVVAFGGGVVGDVAGFAAATYLRGLPVVQVPTTLLSQVDSAIGGKVGVNLAAGKNLVGAFHPPRRVLIDPNCLDTLPRREFRAGMYEVIKYGVIASAELFRHVSSDLRLITNRASSLIAGVIADCVRIKADVVSRDELELGPRRTLNFGHTLGHALEAVTDYRRFLHGEAVAYGMLAAVSISAMRGLMPAEDRDDVVELIRRLGPLPGVSDLRTSDVLEAARRDKKVVNGTLHFVLSAGLGRTCEATDVSTDELRAALLEIGVGT